MTALAPSHRRGDGAVSGVAGRLLSVAALMSAMVVVLGLLRPTDAPSTEAVGLVRVMMTSVLAATLLVGPGLVLRGRSLVRLPLGFVPVPGILLLAMLGLVVWVAAPEMDPHPVAATTVLLVLVTVAVIAWRGLVPLEPDESRALGVAGVVYLLVLGKTLWSLGPAGELFCGTVSRTLEVGDRPDSRLSYHVTSLVTRGLSPYGEKGAALFFPYAFSDRGPIPGLAAAPVMLAAGTTPTAGFPDQAWSVFDPAGFMVYRVVMMLLALAAVLAVHTLARTAAGTHTARLAVLTVAGTPFFVHEVYFTWPKLAAAAMCLLAADLVLHRRPLAAGFFVGLGSLMHPLALLAVPTLLLLMLVNLSGARRSSRRTLFPGLVLGVGALGLGLGAVAGGWRVANAGHPSSTNFLDYFFAANGIQSAPAATWLASRADSVANTLVPLHLPVTAADNPSINSVYGPSDGVVHFFFQYWTGVPFGLAVIFLPALAIGLWSVMRSRPWVFGAVVVAPFAFFALYWGSSVSGLLREGLHPWVLTLVVMWAMHLGSGSSTTTPSLPSWMRWLLAARPLEVAVMLLVPTVHASGRLIGPGLPLGDATALSMMVLGTGILVAITWRGTATVSAQPPRISQTELRAVPGRPGAHR